MKNVSRIMLALSLICPAGFAQCAYADDVTPNFPYVVTDASGTCYALANTEDEQGNYFEFGRSGSTLMFLVGNRTILESRYEFYTQTMQIICPFAPNAIDSEDGPTLIASWGRLEREAFDPAIPVIGFYRHGNAIREYSFGDITGEDFDNASCSISAVYALAQPPILSRADGLEILSAKTVDGKNLRFNAYSGELFEIHPPPTPQVFQSNCGSLEGN